MDTGDVVDPRERYDDLVVDRAIVPVDADTFEALLTSEVAATGWVASALAIDPGERVLLVYDGIEEQWTAPGGTFQSGETLRETAIREVYEETGIEIEVLRPEFVRDLEFHHRADSQEFRFVLYSALAPSEIPSMTPAAEEALTDAGWFETLPEATEERAGTKQILELARERADQYRQG